MLLADLGADVIKVEPPSGDETRRWGPPFVGDVAAYFLAANRNKSALSLDLKDPTSRPVLVELVRQADVLIHNYTGGLTTEFGLNYSDLTAINPDIVCLRITSFGPEEPERRGYDLITQALGGLMSITGSPDSMPVKVGIAISDIAAGLFGTIGILSALSQRGRTGDGAQVDVSLYDSVLALLTNQAMGYLVGGAEPARLGNDHPNVSPYGAYPTADGSIIIAATTDDQFASLCEVIGDPALSGRPEFARNVDRVHHRDELNDLLVSALGEHAASHWSEALSTGGVPNAVIRTIPEVMHAAETKSIRSISHPTYGDTPQIVGPIRFNNQYFDPYLAPPEIDEHSADIVGE
jgi:crotonobetainyl-CoA:carnitine CoA-transferase CaiB-like acyl-CoA transferase